MTGAAAASATHLCQMSTTPSRASAAELLAQRQWRKDVQRSVRCALTAIKKARTEFASCSSEGQASLAELANDILTALKLPGLQLGCVDKEVEGLRVAAAAKLDVRALGGVRALRGCVVEMGQTLQVSDTTVVCLVWPCPRGHTLSRACLSVCLSSNPVWL